MSILSIGASISDQTTGSNIGQSYTYETPSDGLWRLKKKITGTEDSFTWVNVTPGKIAIMNYGLVDPADADADFDAWITWGTALGVRPFKIHQGESHVLELDPAGSVVSIFAQAVTSGAGTFIDQNVGVHVWFGV